VRTRRANTRPSTSIPLAAMLTALALAGCGSAGNDIASKTPAEILAASRVAATSATSVHIISSASEGPLRATLNAQLTASSGRAQVSLLGLTFEVIRIGKTIYLKGSPSVYRRLGITTKIPQGTWLEAPANGQLAQIAAFTNLNGELNRILPAHNDTLTKGTTTTLNGQHALQLNTTAKLFKGTLYITTTGKPYPIKLTKHGRETGQATFTNWNKPTTLNPPTNTITLNQLEHKRP
jgi:hypothetical protein